MENFLLRTVPGLAGQWKGSTSDEIARLEQLAGRPLPPFYRWFLSRMGQDMGALALPRFDFSAQGLLTHFAEQRMAPDPRALLIARGTDDQHPVHLFYDLEAPLRGDARVTSRPTRDGALHEHFETLRELLAWEAMFRFILQPMAQRCTGTLLSGRPDALALIDRQLTDLKFITPIDTGRFCGLYARPNAAIVIKRIAAGDAGNVHAFSIGAKHEKAIDQLLGELSDHAAVEIEVGHWDPPLASDVEDEDP